MGGMIPHDGGSEGIVTTSQAAENPVNEGHGFSRAVNSIENTSGFGVCMRTSGSTLILGGVCALT
jgi:hypothetical protein